MPGAVHDVIVVGGGHNGLTCAAYLGRAGRGVLVLEEPARVPAAVRPQVFPAKPDEFV